MLEGGTFRFSHIILYTGVILNPINIIFITYKGFRTNGKKN